jgi:myo-inositol-1(or 4)-monophosphatase
MSSIELSDTDLQDLLQFTVGLATAAGKQIRQGSEAVSTVDEKKNAVDLVTEWDKAVEALIKDKISAKYGPRFGLYVERLAPLPLPLLPPKDIDVLS